MVLLFKKGRRWLELLGVTAAFGRDAGATQSDVRGAQDWRTPLSFF